MSRKVNGPFTDYAMLAPFWRILCRENVLGTDFNSHCNPQFSYQLVEINYQMSRSSELVKLSMSRSPATLDFIRWGSGPFFCNGLSFICAVTKNKIPLKKI